MKIESAKVSAVPGDPLRRMTKGATDSTGRYWPAGTTYRPESAGFDNDVCASVQVVRIEGQLVTFTEAG